MTTILHFVSSAHWLAGRAYSKQSRKNNGLMTIPKSWLLQ